MYTQKTWNNKKILVTGGTGLIGGTLVHALIKVGADVTVCGRSKDKIISIFESEIRENKLKYLVANISNELPDTGEVYDFIFHAASPISGAEIKEKPVDTIEANLSGSRNCLEFLKRQQTEKGKKGRLIVFSSATVYGSRYNQDICVTEDQTYDSDVLDSLNGPYSESKRMIEVLSRAYCKQYDVDSVIVRIGYAYGYSKNMPNTAFYEFIKKGLCGEKIILNNSGMGRRDNIHVDDVVRGLMAVALAGVTGEAYNISSAGQKGNFSAIDEIANIIAQCAFEMNVNEYKMAEVKPMTEPRAPGLMLDNAKVKQLGWEVEIELKEGIMKTLEAYVNNK